MPANWTRIDKPNQSHQSQGVDKPNQSHQSQANVTVSSDTSSETPEIQRMEMFVPETPNRSLNDLIVSAKVKTQIETALNSIRFHDVLYHEWNLKKIDPHGHRVAINLFGSPGTGKTFCAEAIAHHLSKPIIRVNYAEIESKYVGETPKNIKAAFNKARETGAVLLFDEADSILGKRLTNVTQSADHGVNVSRSVMFLELNNFNGIVIFATNLPGNYDGAFVRRIQAHIEFELPNEDCRMQLWNLLLPTEVPRADDITVEWLAQESIGLAGGDILNVVKLAASQAVVRTGEERRILQSDIRNAVTQVQLGKEKVGTGFSYHNQSTTTVVKEEIVSPEELPSDVREKYEQVLEQDNVSDSIAVGT